MRLAIQPIVNLGLGLHATTQLVFDTRRDKQKHMCQSQTWHKSSQVTDVFQSMTQRVTVPKVVTRNIKKFPSYPGIQVANFKPYSTLTAL